MQVIFIWAVENIAMDRVVRFGWVRLGVLVFYNAFLNRTLLIMTVLVAPARVLVSCVDAGKGFQKI